MSAIGMILTASLVTIGAVALVRRFQHQTVLHDQKKSPKPAQRTMIFDLKKNPQTGVFERTD